MKYSARFLLFSAFCVVTLRGEHAIGGPDAVSGTAPVAEARVKPKRLRWLRRICSGEVDLAVRLSSIGIPKTGAPEPGSLASESDRAKVGSSVELPAPPELLLSESVQKQFAFTR
jgi:hypothetical protein